MARTFATAWVFALAVATVINGAIFLPGVLALFALWVVAPRSQRASRRGAKIAP